MRYGSVKSLAAVALIFGSAQAMAAPQSSARALSLAPATASVPVARVGASSKEGRSSLGGGNGFGIALLAVVVAGAAYGAYEMIDGDSDDNPVSN